jgi:hypothetical protein
VAATVVGAGYGVFLIVTGLRMPPGAELAGQFALQPAVKAYATSLLLITAGFFFGRASVPSATPSE